MFESQKIDFLAFLEDSNYTVGDEGEIILTVPVIEIGGDFQVDIPINITSNCNTTIKSYSFRVSSDSNSFSKINFETTLHIEGSLYFSISNCTIKNLQYESPLIITDCKNALISHVTISDSNKIGLLISNSVVKADNLSINNIKKDNSITCQNGSVFTITNSQLRFPKDGGIYVYDETKISIDNTTFSDMGYNSIYLTNSNCCIKNSTFNNIKSSCINIYNSKAFLIENNQFTNIEESAITTEESCGTIIKNKIYEIKGNGINVLNSDVLIKENIIENSKYPGIAVIKNSSATLVNNKIRKSKQNGIVVREANHFELEGSEIEDVGFCGISISDSNSVLIQHNSIKKCKKSAIEAFNNSKVTVKKNLIFDVSESAFDAFLGSSIFAQENEIKNVKNSLAKLTFKSGGEFVKNNVSNCTDLMSGNTLAPYFFFENGNFKNMTNDRSKIDDSIIFVENQKSEQKNEDDVLCLKCNKNKRDSFVFPCAHKAFCKECAEKALADKELCPLCRLQIWEIMTAINSNNENLCIICYENKADCIISPCGHIAGCYSCIKKWFETKNICPICRKENCRFKKIYADF